VDFIPKDNWQANSSLLLAKNSWPPLSANPFRIKAALTKVFALVAS